jgi:hypothetical protein
VRLARDPEAGDAADSNSLDPARADVEHLLVPLVVDESLELRDHEANAGHLGFR